MSEIFLDIETTGLSFKDNHKIVEIACIETNELIPTKRVFHNTRKISEKAIYIRSIVWRKKFRMTFWFLFL